MTYRLVYEVVDIKKKEEWPARWLTSPPGTLCLMDGAWGSQYGLLHIVEGIWVPLRPEQIFAGDLIPWPDKNAVVSGLRLNGVAVQLVLKTDPLEDLMEPYSAQ